MAKKAKKKAVKPSDRSAEFLGVVKKPTKKVSKPVVNGASKKATPEVVYDRSYLDDRKAVKFGFVRRLSVADLHMIAAGDMKDPRPAPLDPPIQALTVRKPGVNGSLLCGYRTPDAIVKLARLNIGSADNYQAPRAYHLAYQIEMARLRKKYRMEAELEASVIQPGSLTHGYRAEYAEVARVACSVYGSTMDELASFFRVGVETISEWARIYPDFYAAMYDRASETNMTIMRRLARRAQGFHVDTERIFFDVKRGQVVRAKTKEYYPPSESAIFFWLKNRMPEHWKDVKDVNIEEKRKVVLELYKNIDSMTQEQASDAYQELLKAAPEAEALRGRGPVSDVPFTERDSKDGGTQKGTSGADSS